MTKKQSTMLYLVLGTTGLTRMKEDLCWVFSGERTARTSRLNNTEFNNMINYLLNINETGMDEEAKLHHQIFHYAHEMKWELPDGRVDINKIDKWCMHFSGKNKTLDQFSIRELPELVRRLEVFYNDFLAN